MATMGTETDFETLFAKASQLQAITSNMQCAPIFDEYSFKAITSDICKGLITHEKLMREPYSTFDASLRSEMLQATRTVRDVMESMLRLPGAFLNMHMPVLGYDPLMLSRFSYRRYRDFYGGRTDGDDFGISIKATADLKKVGEEPVLSLLEELQKTEKYANISWKRIVSQERGLSRRENHEREIWRISRKLTSNTGSEFAYTLSTLLDFFIALAIKAQVCYTNTYIPHTKAHVQRAVYNPQPCLFPASRCITHMTYLMRILFGESYGKPSAYPRVAVAVVSMRFVIRIGGLTVVFEK